MARPTLLQRPGDRPRSAYVSKLRTFSEDFVGALSNGKISPHDAVLIDLLRAIAAILVVIFHARIYTLGGSEMTDLNMLAYAATNCGTQAVFWFFVLSGYLVGGSAIMEVVRTGRLDFRRYVISRSTRLYIVLIPALILTGLLDYVRVATFGMNSHNGFETSSSYEMKTFIGNLFFLQTTAVPTFGSNLALWSLANEFWYYLTFPLLLSSFMTALPVWSRLGLTAAGIAVLSILSLSNFSIVWLFSLWCMGAAARVLPLRFMQSRLLAMLLAIVAVVSFPVLHPHIGPLATLVVGLSFTNMLLTLRSDARSESILFSAAAKRLAAFSFSLYIVHLPLQHLLLTMFQGHGDPFLGFDPNSLATPAAIIMLAAASIAVGYVFSLITEAHTDAFRVRISRYL